MNRVLFTVALLAGLSVPPRARGDDAGDGDGAPTAVDGGGCGAIPEQGCCVDRRLYFCRAGVLETLDCSNRPACGWSESGRYDCNTAGSADPRGTWAKRCPLGDGGVVVPDAGNACGPIRAEGCCAGAVLRYCERGALRQVDCRSNPKCGWQGNGQIYNCGTGGEEDPSGAHPLACAGPAPDTGPLPGGGAVDAAADGTGGAGADGGASGDSAPGRGGEGCGCHASPSAMGVGQPVWLLLLARRIRRRRPRR